MQLTKDATFLKNWSCCKISSSVFMTSLIKEKLQEYCSYTLQIRAILQHKYFFSLILALHVLCRLFA